MSIQSIHMSIHMPMHTSIHMSIHITGTATIPRVYNAYAHVVCTSPHALDVELDVGGRDEAFGVVFDRDRQQRDPAAVPGDVAQTCL